jgi:16S rRNA (uracil1498-N3)-methyltransferase
MTRRLFGPASAAAGERVTLDPDARKHAKVLRLGPGTTVELFDGEGHLAEAELLEGGEARIVRSWRAEPSGPARILVWGLPKASAADIGVRMATELGVDRILPAIAERTPREPSSAKVERWRRIAREATRQCERPSCPEIAEPTPLARAAAVEADERRVALARGAGGHDPVGAGSVALAIGPEGGFTEDEQSLLADLGYRPLFLGAHVLRSETAVAAALALAQPASQLYRGSRS